ncbi:MAG: family 43 glycosylhydrolase [Lachnospiraceae bacterium]|nr:family 43 glycosylhydrolase [Lachnospiraceae bacterium]
MICSPYLPGWEYIADGEPHVFGDRLYIFGSHDRFNGKRFCMNDYVGWSAPLKDLSDWQYEGVTFRKDQDPDNRDGKNELWAPDAACGPDGRYYLYYCLANYPKIGVAVCDRPAGQYEFLGYVHDSNGNILGQRDGDIWPFDPAVLVDDGHIHLYAGQGPLDLKMAKKQAKTHKFTCHMELEPDMVTLKTEPVPLIPSVTNSAGTGFEGHEFFEGSSIRKFDGKYYFIYSSIRCHELCWAVSDRPDGGFHYGGTLVSNGDIGLEGDIPFSFTSKANPGVRNYIGNNHGSVEKIGDAYYVFYHRQTNRHMYSRQACAARIRFENGEFRQAEMTSCGLADQLPGKGYFEARIACQLYSAEGALFSVHPMVQNKKHPAFTQDTSDGQSGEQYISNMRNGASAVFKYFAPAEISQIRLTVRGKGKGQIQVYVNDQPAAAVDVIPSKDWTTISAPFTPASEKYSLRFTFEGQKAVDFKAFELL